MKKVDAAKEWLSKSDYVNFLGITFGLGLVTVAGYITTRIILTVYGLEILGIYDLTITTITLFATLLTIGIGNPLSKLFNDPETTTAQKLFVTISIAAIALSVSIILPGAIALLNVQLFSDLFGAELLIPIMVIGLGIVLLLFSFNRLISLLLRATQRGELHVFSEAIRSFSLAGIFIFLFFFLNASFSFILLTALLLSSLIYTIFVGVYIYRKDSAKIQTAWSEIRQLEKTQVTQKFLLTLWPFAFSELSVLILTKVQKYVILWHRPENFQALLGIFALAMFFRNTMAMAFMGLSWRANPMILNAAQNRSPELKRIVSRSTLYALFIASLLILVTLFFGSTIVSVLFSVLFIQNDLLVMLILALCIEWCFYPLNLIFIANENFIFLGMSSVTTALLSLLLSYTFFPIMGLVAIGVGTLIGRILNFAIRLLNFLRLNLTRYFSF